jgi:excisionase family DNA binding protein
MAVSRLVLRTELLTVKQAAHILNVHENTLGRWCDEGVIASCRSNSHGDRHLFEGFVGVCCARL